MADEYDNHSDRGDDRGRGDDRDRGERIEDERAAPSYERRERSRERSRSPDRYSDRERRRSVSPRRDDDYYSRDSRDGPAPAEDDVDAQNEGTNLFVTGLSRSVTEAELEELFTRYAPVEKCQIMLDPHTRESRGFGFVNMVDVSGADSVLSELQGFELAGKTLSLEKAKRKRPRTPTPGKYFGPPKPRRRGGGRPRYYDDRYSSRDRSYSRRYDDRYDDHYRRGPSSRYDDRDPYYRDRSYSSRYEDRDRYGGPPPPREYRDYRDGRESGYRSPPPRDDRPPRDYRDDRGAYREERPYRESYSDRERDDYRRD